MKLKDLKKVIPWGLIVRIYDTKYEKIVFEDCFGKLDSKWNNFKVLCLQNERLKDNTFYMRIDLVLEEEE